MEQILTIKFAGNHVKVLHYNFAIHDNMTTSIYVCLAAIKRCKVILLSLEIEKTRLCQHDC